jgi:hypothetical protein
MIPDYEKRRPCFLLQALDDAKKWCAAPDPRTGRPRSDQRWLRLFSSPSETVTPERVREFFVVYRLARQGRWDVQAVADLIMDLRERGGSAIQEIMSLLAERLRNSVTRGDKADRQQTSAASKIGFFMRPGDEVYIWDQFASRSARFRDWLRAGAGAKPPRFERPYASASGVHDYASYSASCAKALEEECLRGDFAESVQEFCAFLRRVGGPMADAGILASSFVERRFLDKLMFWEGRWVKDIQALRA